MDFFWKQNCETIDAIDNLIDMSLRLNESTPIFQSYNKHQIKN